MFKRYISQYNTRAELAQIDLETSTLSQALKSTVNRQDPRAQPGLIQPPFPGYPAQDEVSTKFENIQGGREN